MDSNVANMSKIGRYEMTADAFHCDFNMELQMGHLGNYLLNAADFHSSDRGFGMRTLNTENKTWVLSRLCIEMFEKPMRNSKFFVETWVENAMRYFTQRNFRMEDKDTGNVLGYGRSIWALIDTVSRQPVDIMQINDGDIMKWVETDKECPIDKPGRVKMSKDCPLVTTIDTHYCDVDVNGHINSVKYIEHILDLFPLEWYKEHKMERFDIAYVSETYYGDKLNIYKEDVSDNEVALRLTKTPQEGGEDVEVVRCLIRFS